MCLPLQLLKCIISFNAILVILLGIVSIISSILIWLQGTGISAILLNEDSKLKHTLIILIFISGIVLILFGLAGWYGGVKKKKKFLTCFNFGLLLALVFFIMIGSSSYILSDVYRGSSENCQNLSWSLEIEQYVQLAEQSFCQTCQCYISDLSQWPSSYFQGFSIQTNNNQGAIQYQDCSDFIANSKSPFLDACEQLFKCAGWCNPYKIYMFSDVNRGQPDKIESCFQLFARWMEEHGNTIGAVSLTIASLLAVSIILSICLCFHPEKKKGNIYSRMAFYE